MLPEIAATTTAISGAIQLIKFMKAGMNPMPDVVATSLAELNEKILDIQISVMEINEVVFKKTEEIRELREALSKKDEYSLFDLGSGKFVYRYNAPPVGSDGSDPVSAKPPHDVCQRCFDEKGIHSVLQKIPDGSILHCLVCQCGIHLW